MQKSQIGSEKKGRVHSPESISIYLFSTDSSAVTVTLEGSDCTIDTVSFSDTEIQCLIPAQSGTVETEVRVTLGQRTAVEVRIELK